MAYFVYNKDTLSIASRHDTERGAKIAYSRKHKDNPSMTWSDVTTYNALDEDVTVENAVTGKPVTIRKSQRGGPCDPSTERYHCM